MKEIEKFLNLYKEPQRLKNIDQFFQEENQNDPLFLSKSFLMFFQSKISNNQRIFIFYVLKYLILQKWNSFYLGSNDKIKILKYFETFYKGYKNNRLIMFELGQLLGKLFLLKNKQEEEEFLNQIMNNILENIRLENQYLLNQLLMVQEIINCGGNKVNFFFNNLFQKLIEIFQSEESNLDTREQILSIIYLSFKNMIAIESIENFENQLFLQQNTIQWIPYFISILNIQKSEYHKSQIYVLKIITILIRYQSNGIQEVFPQILKFFLKFLLIKCGQQIRNIYLKGEQNFYINDYTDIEDLNDYQSLQEAVLISSIDVLNSILMINELQFLIQEMTLPIIWSVSHLLIINKNENFVDIIEENDYKEQNYEGKINIKKSILNLFNTLVEYQRVNFLKLFLEIIYQYIFREKESDQYIQNQLTQYQQIYKQLDINLKLLPIKLNKFFVKFENQLWKRKLIGIDLLKYFATDFYGIKNDHFQEHIFVQKIYEILKNEKYNQIIQAKCLQTLITLKHLIKGDEDYFLDLFDRIISLININQQFQITCLSLKTISIIGNIVVKMQLQNNVKNYSQKNLNECFEVLLKILKIVKIEKLEYILDSSLCLIDINLKNFKKQQIDEFLGIIVDRIFSIQSTLEIFPLISQILKKLFKNDQHSIQKFIELINIKLLNKNFDQQEKDKFDFILQMIYHIVKINQNDPVCQNFIKNLWKNKKQFENVFNFTRFTTIITQEMDLNDQDLQQIGKQLWIELSNIQKNEADCIYLGNLALNLYNENIKKQIFHQQLIQKLSKCSLPQTNQGIMIFYSHLFKNDMNQTMEIIKDIQIGPKYGLKILLDHWLLHQPKFIGPVTKTITVQGLINLYQKKLNIIKDLYVIGINPSHQRNSPEIKFPLKLYSLLVEIYDYETKIQKNNQNQELTTTQQQQKYLNEIENQNERLETIDFDEEDNDQSLEVDMNIQSFGSIESDENQINGFKGVETGSQSYLSGLLGFDDLDIQEWDIFTEEQLCQLGYQEKNLKIIIENFFKEIKNTSYYQSLQNSLDSNTSNFMSKIIQFQN